MLSNHSSVPKHKAGPPLSPDIRYKNRLFFLPLPVRYHICHVCFVQVRVSFASHAPCGRCLLYCRQCDLCGGRLPSLIASVSPDIMHTPSGAPSPQDPVPSLPLCLSLPHLLKKSALVTLFQHYCCRIPPSITQTLCQLASQCFAEC